MGLEEVHDNISAIEKADDGIIEKLIKLANYRALSVDTESEGSEEFKKDFDAAFERLLHDSQSVEVDRFEIYWLGIPKSSIGGESGAITTCRLLSRKELYAQQIASAQDDTREYVLVIKQNNFLPEFLLNRRAPSPVGDRSESPLEVGRVFVENNEVYSKASSDDRGLIDRVIAVGSIGNNSYGALLTDFSIAVYKMDAVNQRTWINAEFQKISTTMAEFVGDRAVDLTILNTQLAKLAVSVQTTYRKELTNFMTNLQATFVERQANLSYSAGVDSLEFRPI